MVAEVEKEKKTHEVEVASWPDRTALIVDDTPVNLTVLETMLANTPLNVIATEEPQDVFEIINNQTVDIVITDAKMPTISGLDLCRAIRAMDIVKQPIVILSSAENKADLWQDCIDAGVDFYLEKPFDEPELFQLIDQTMPDWD